MTFEADHLAGGVFLLTTLTFPSTTPPQAWLR